MNDAIIDEVLKDMEKLRVNMENFQFFGVGKTLEKAIGVIAHLRAKNAELEETNKLFLRIVETLTSQQPEEKDK